jgi:hypothetical protein
MTDTALTWAWRSLDEWLERERLQPRCGVCGEPAPRDGQDGCEACDE